MRNSLTILRDQQAVVVGEGGVPPKRTRFDGLPEERCPQSDTVSCAGQWQSRTIPGGLVAGSLERRRKQLR